ncbi:MAG TPA: autotransporter-associated beta strand repeat-containing protein, partial [Rariglobus sp.]
SDVSIASGTTLQFGSGSLTETIGSLSGSGTLGLNTSALTTTNSTADTTFSGTITGGTGGTLTKAGTFALTLDSANSYTGATTVSAGALIVRNSSALGTASSGNTVASGGALHLGGGVTVTETDFTVSGTGVSNDGAIRNVDGANTLAATVNLGGATTITNAGGTLAVSGTVGLGSNTLTVVGGSGTTFSGSIQGTGGYTQTSGTVTFSGGSANTYSGTTNVTGGTLSLGKTAGVNALAGGAINIGSGATVNLLANEQIANNSGLLTVSSGGTLQLNNFTETIDSLAGSGLIDLGASGHLVLGSNNGSSTFGGSIAGSGILEKIGSGSLTFNSSLNFTGELRLGGGTMALNGNNLTVTTLHITANSVIDFGTSAASLLSASTLVIDSGVTLTINGWADMVDYFMAGTFTGATVEVRGSGSASQVVFSGFSGGTLWNRQGQITPVPEPSTYGALFLTLAAGAYVWRRRRRGA